QRCVKIDGMKPILVCLLLTAVAHGADPVLPGFGGPDMPPSEEELKKPVLSVTGKKRLRANIQTLENNLRDLRDNLQASNANIETVKAELADLQTLEKEHYELRKRYESYLAHSREEIAKNDRAKRDLAKWEETQKKLPKE